MFIKIDQTLLLFLQNQHRKFYYQKQLMALKQITTSTFFKKGFTITTIIGRKNIRKSMAQHALIIQNTMVLYSVVSYVRQRVSMKRRSFAAVRLVSNTVASLSSRKHSMALIQQLTRQQKKETITIYFFYSFCCLLFFSF